MCRYRGQSLVRPWAAAAGRSIVLADTCRLATQTNVTSFPEATLRSESALPERFSSTTEPITIVDAFSVG